jgi:tetratricopeptide (TPR) repeat protein
MSRVGPKPKKLPVEHTTSAAAVDRIANFVHLMDHEFHQFGPPETGIDGSIELSDPATHTMTGKVIFMQSKSHTGVFEKETENAFEFPLERRDLDGWLALTVPVILIVSRPARDQYFWVDIKNYFEQSARSERAVVEFDKDRDRFTEDCSADLFEVVEREANRRALVRRALVHGPVYLLKLDEELERARLAASQQRFNDSAPLWAQIANAAEEKLPAPFTWTFREREANALNTIGRHEDAYKIYLQLVRDRLDADDPSAQFDIGRAYFAHRTGVAEDFEFALLAARAATPIDGSDGIERLRLLHERAPTTAEKVEAAAALVDVLAFWGEWDEVIAVTDRVALKRLNPLRRQLLLDRLDALGERGIACDDDWARLLKSSRQVGQSVHAQTLQRRAVALSRTSDIEAAQEYFRKAAEFWSDVPEADEQVAEALAGVEATARLGGLLTPDALPFAANHVFAVARGSAMLPVARAERVMLAGFAALADGGTANALRFLTLAAMIERRAGDLAGYLQATAGVARAYEAAGDPKTALQWWIRTGRAERREGQLRGRQSDAGPGTRADLRASRQLRDAQRVGRGSLRQTGLIDHQGDSRSGETTATAARAVGRLSSAQASHSDRAEVHASTRARGGRHLSRRGAELRLHTRGLSGRTRRADEQRHRRQRPLLRRNDPRRRGSGSLDRRLSPRRPSRAAAADRRRGRSWQPARP